jgi:CBS domain-containing protein
VPKRLKPSFRKSIAGWRKAEEPSSFGAITDGGSFWQASARPLYVSEFHHRLAVGRHPPETTGAIRRRMDSQEVTMYVRDAMTPNAEWISPDLTLVEVGRRMRDKSIGCLPVGEKDHLIGMITDHDLCYRAIADGADPKTTKAREVMTRGVTWCFDDQGLDEAVRLMGEKQIHHLPVLSRRNRMVGILSLSDLAFRGDKETAKEVSKLVSRDASRHASRAG